MDEVVNLIYCERCARDNVVASSKNKHLCEDCSKAENNRYSFLRTQNAGWMEVSKEAGLELWERQPQETEREYQIWLHYRDSYPSIKPSQAEVARQLCTTRNVVHKVAKRWDFSVRMQAWATYTDGIILARRTNELIDMNKAHVDMANNINEKLQKAIRMLDPATMSPRDIASLLKLSTELESKARVDTIERYHPVVLEDVNPDLKVIEPNVSDLSEIVAILEKAKVLGNSVGVKKTVTTEVVIKDD